MLQVILAVIVGRNKHKCLSQKEYLKRTKVQFISFDPQVIQGSTTNASQAIDTLNKLQENSKDGHTYIDAAVREAAKLFESQPSEKEKSKKVFITFTDGLAF